jgi:ATP-dependent DNA helicase RecQ
MCHVAQVLTGSDQEKIRRWEHDKISTYGIGREFSQAEWTTLGRELIRLGYVRQDGDRFNTLELTETGRRFLRQPGSIKLRKSASIDSQPLPKPTALPCDLVLLDQLAAIRSRLAAEKNLRSYLILSDVGLRQIAREYPVTSTEFSRISSVSQKKLQEFGPVFIEAVAGHLKQHPRQTFEPLPLERQPRSMSPSASETWQLFEAGLTVAAIATRRELGAGTVYSHLVEAVAAGRQIDPARLAPIAAQREIAAAFQRLGSTNLTGIREALNNQYDYGLLRLLRETLAGRSTTSSIRGNGEPVPSPDISQRS